MSKLSGKLQTAEIEFHRSILGARRVELNNYPQWWIHRVCWATSGWGRWACMKGMHSLEGGELRVFDHSGSSAYKSGDRLFVTEPYQRWDDPRLYFAVRKIAAALGLHARICNPWQSWWYPGQTCRIEFCECRNSPPCAGCKSREQLRDESRDRKRKRRR